MAKINLIKFGMIGLVLLTLSLLVIGFGVRTVYNPFSGKLDYIRDGNFTGENLTANYYKSNLDNTGLIWNSTFNSTTNVLSFTWFIDVGQVD